jgi:hypothetical protein
MRTLALASLIGLLALAGPLAEGTTTLQRSNPAGGTGPAVERGARWLASVQGADGGWGQDGGETSYIRVGENLESNGNDVANTAVAALALLRAGPRYRPNVERGVEFVLESIEASPQAGLTITDRQGTQIQRKLGPYIDTFLASRLLNEVDGTLSTRELNARVRQALEKTVRKIQQNQKADGSWNIDGGWAPVLGTSLASQSLFEAQAKGLRVDREVLDRAEDYTRRSLASPAPAEAAGVPLYQSAQALEQLSRTEEDRERNADEIAAISGQLADARFVDGFGSVGGEEFFSYLNISDSLERTGGPERDRWHARITEKILDLQNNDGSWAGHHCITGRVAVTAAAILNLAVNHAG